MVTDYRLLIMDFKWKGKIVHLTGEHQVNDELLQGKKLMKLTKAQDIAPLFHLKAVENEDLDIHVPACMQPPLQQYSYIF